MKSKYDELCGDGMIFFYNNVMQNIEVNICQPASGKLTMRFLGDFYCLFMSRYSGWRKFDE